VIALVAVLFHNHDNDSFFSFCFLSPCPPPSFSGLIMKKTILLSACAALISLNPVSAQAESGLDLPGKFSANVALTSEYVFRGISQSNEEPTIQGGIDWAHEETGFYLGTWGSGVDFTDASSEFDFYGGINGVTAHEMTWDLGAIYYHYPGASDDLNYDFWELAAAVGYDFDIFSLSAALNWSPDYFGGSGDAVYTALYTTVPLPYGFTGSGSVAYQWIDDNDAFGVDDYADWSLGVNYMLEGFDLGLKYTQTSLDEPEDCADGCDARIIFSVGKTF
jgi:uncharacterized protein (TIGR02001 family)